MNYHLTFNISDEQRRSWVARYGNVTEGFRRELLYRTRHAFDGPLVYWFAVEPKKSRGKAADNYADGPHGLRRFDIHMALAFDADEEGIPQSVSLERFQRAVWNRTLKLGKDRRDARYPLFQLGGMAKMGSLHCASGWHQYAFKSMRRTLQKHRDVVGDRPWGASHVLRARTKALYDEIRAIALSEELDPAYVKRAKALIGEGLEPFQVCLLRYDDYYDDSLFRLRAPKA